MVPPFFSPITTHRIGKHSSGRHHAPALLTEGIPSQPTRCPPGYCRGEACLALFTYLVGAIRCAAREGCSARGCPVRFHQTGLAGRDAAPTRLRQRRWTDGSTGETGCQGGGGVEYSYAVLGPCCSGGYGSWSGITGLTVWPDWLSFRAFCARSSLFAPALQFSVVCIPGVPPGSGCVSRLA